MKMQNCFLSLAFTFSLCAFASENNTDALIEQLRDRIDESILGIDKNSWGRSLMGSLASVKKSWSLDEHTALGDLQAVESYIPSGCDKKELYDGLAQRHWYVHALLQYVVLKQAETFAAVSGSTVDALLVPDRKIPGVSLVMNSLIQQKVRPEVFERIDCRLADQKIFFDGIDIHLTPLFAQKHVSVMHDNLVTSTDGKYARSTDDDGNVIIWSLEAGCSVQIADPNTQWERRHSQEAYDPHAVIDRTDQHAIFTNARYQSLLASYPRHIDFVENRDNGGYLMVLFKRPTRESRMCNAAFKNSRGNKDELEQLLNSKAFQKIQGFPAANLKFLIEKELRDLSNQQAKL